MEGGFGGLFGGDPDEFQRRLGEAFEQLQSQQGLAGADNAINLAVQMTVAAVSRVNLLGNADAQAEQIRAVMATVFPQAGALARAARRGGGERRPRGGARGSPRPPGPENRGGAAPRAAPARPATRRRSPSST